MSKQSALDWNFDVIWQYAAALANSFGITVEWQPWKPTRTPKRVKSNNIKSWFQNDKLHLTHTQNLSFNESFISLWMFDQVLSAFWILLLAFHLVRDAASLCTIQRMNKRTETQFLYFHLSQGWQAGSLKSHQAD